MTAPDPRLGKIRSKHIMGEAIEDADVAYLLAELRKRDEALARVEDLCQSWQRMATTDNTHDTTLRAVVYAVRASAAVRGQV